MWVTEGSALVSGPRVSVLMGVYNGADCVGRAIGSIQAQTLQNWELVVCDDGSTDSTAELLSEFAHRDARIKIVRHERNRGLAAALNNCLRHARAELCARQDADDWSCPERLATQVRAFETEPELVVVGSAAWYCDEQDRAWGRSQPVQCPTVRHLIRGSCFTHVSVMYRKSAVLAAGGYDESAGRCEDYDLWFRLLSFGAGRNLPEALVRVRWPQSAYLRRQFRDRLAEAKVRWRGYRRTRVPWYAYVYAAKPLIVGMVPRAWLWVYHAARMRGARPSGPASPLPPGQWEGRRRQGVE